MIASTDFQHSAVQRIRVLEKENRFLYHLYAEYPPLSRTYLSAFAILQEKALSCIASTRNFSSFDCGLPADIIKVKTGILVDDLVLYAIGRNVPCGEHAKKPIPSTEIVNAFFRAGGRPRKWLGRR
jgi:hypothetical protein